MTLFIDECECELCADDVDENSPATFQECKVPVVGDFCVKAKIDRTGYEYLTSALLGFARNDCERRDALEMVRCFNASLCLELSPADNVEVNNYITTTESYYETLNIAYGDDITNIFPDNYDSVLTDVDILDKVYCDAIRGLVRVMAQTIVRSQQQGETDLLGKVSAALFGASTVSTAAAAAGVALAGFASPFVALGLALGGLGALAAAIISSENIPSLLDDDLLDEIACCWFFYLKNNCAAPTFTCWQNSLNSCDAGSDAANEILTAFDAVLQGNLDLYLAFFDLVQTYYTLWGDTGLEPDVLECPCLPFPDCVSESINWASFGATPIEYNGELWAGWGSPTNTFTSVLNRASNTVWSHNNTPSVWQQIRVSRDVLCTPNLISAQFRRNTANQANFRIVVRRTAGGPPITVAQVQVPVGGSPSNHNLSWGNPEGWYVSRVEFWAWTREPRINTTSIN